MIVCKAKEKKDHVGGVNTHYINEGKGGTLARQTIMSVPAKRRLCKPCDKNKSQHYLLLTCTSANSCMGELLGPAQLLIGPSLTAIGEMGGGPSG